MPDFAKPLSAQLKETETLVLFQPWPFARGLRLPLIAGDVLSMLMPSTAEGEAALPALSMQVPVFVRDWPLPSPLTVPPATVSVAMPDRTAPVSAQLKETPASVLFQPWEFARGLRLPLITGDVLSMLIPSRVVGEAALPALSMQSPLLVRDWPAPSPLTVPPTTVSSTMPDWTKPESAQLKETATSPLFQPWPFARGLRLPLMAGDVLSMLMLATLAGEAGLPALSTQLPLLVTDWPAPSPLTIAPATVSVAMPDRTAPVSAQLKETATSVLFQPWAFASGLRLPTICGAVLSMLILSRVVGEAALPALSVQVPVLVRD